MDSSGRTPLMVAVEGSLRGVPGCLSIVEMLSQVYSSADSSKHLLTTQGGPDPAIQLLGWWCLCQTFCACLCGWIALGGTVESLGPDAEPVCEAVAEDPDYVYIAEDDDESD